MESQPQNPEYRNNPENFHPCITMSQNPPVSNDMAYNMLHKTMILKLNEPAHGISLLIAVVSSQGLLESCVFTQFH